MSSEMRDLIERVVEAAVALERVESSWCGDPNELEVPRRELEDAKSALLARTEAGAVCDHAWQPDSDVMNARYCPKCDVTQTIPKKLTHPQDASRDAERYCVLHIGNNGAAYDPPNTRRAFTYEKQPGNIDASRLGRAADAAAIASAGDSIDRGLALLKELQALGFGVFHIGTAAMQAKEAK